MVGGDRGKKQKVKEAGDEDSEQLDTELVLSIEKLQEFQDQLDKISRLYKLQEFQDQLDKINEEASEEVLAVEQKYNVKRRPVYMKRDEVIKTIPDFWLTAFLSHPALGDLLNEEDAKIFKFLDSLDVEDFKDLKFGYSITFNFKPNPFFEDTKLTKTFTFSDDGTTKITGTKINWKEGKDVANGVDHEKKGNKRPPSEDSFFTWFSETQENDIVEGFNDEVAEMIKEDLWPNPLKYVNNEVDEEGSEGDEDDEEDDDEGEEDGDEEE